MGHRTFLGKKKIIGSTYFFWKTKVCVEQSLSLLIWDPEKDLQVEKLKEFVIEKEFEELEKEREKKD